MPPFYNIRSKLILPFLLATKSSVSNKTLLAVCALDHSLSDTTVNTARQGDGGIGKSVI